jgi:uncharacterized repeat protein (TIGR01451 family)
MDESGTRTSPVASLGYLADRDMKRTSLRRRARLSLNGLEDRTAPALGTFELDGNATTQSTVDWDRVYNDAVLNPTQNASGSIPGAVVFLHDPVSSATDNIFAGGQTTDLNDVTAWRWTHGAPQQKSDIANIYAAAYDVPVGNTTHTVVNFGADRISNNGNATMGFWFFQNPVSVNANGTFSGTHTVGDILIEADFTSSVALFTAYRWVGSGGSAGSLDQVTIGSANGFAIANTAFTPTGGWPFQDAVGSPPNTFAPGEFFEAGLDLTALGLPSHLSSFLAETRSSTSLNAALADFAVGTFPTFTADVAVTKAVDNPSPDVGDTVTFTVTATNNGPNDATGVVVYDPLPAGLTFVSASPSQGTYDSTTGKWTVGGIARGQSATLQLRATVVPPGPATVTNVATATADQTDPNPNNNTGSVVVTPRQADLVLTKTVNNPTPNVGDTITFTLNLTNQGPSAAANVAVNDLLPAGLSFQSATPTQGTYNSTTGAWTVGTLANLATAKLTIIARVDSVAAVTNTGVATATTFDPNTANNQASALVSPQSADLALTKAVDNPTPTVGDVVTFTVTLTNNGPNVATAVSVQDLLPAGLTFVSATPSRGTYAPATGVWAVGSLGVAASATLTLRATVTGQTAATNTAAVAGADQFDPVTGNNTATATITPQVADLVLAKAVSNPTPNVGDTITFTLTLRNAGPNPAAGVAVNDPLPAGLTFVDAVPSQGTYSAATGRWTVGTLASGATVTLVITAQVTGPEAGTNTAVASATTFDPNTANNTGSATYTPQQADLAVTKTVDDPTPTIGDTVTFTVTLTNNGPNAATGVTVRDLLPAGLALVTATPGQGSYDSATGAWTVGTLASGVSTTLVLRAIVTGTAAATNVASVLASDVFDPKPANNTAQAIVTPQVADLHLVKTVNQPRPNVGDVITFTLTLTNQGPNAATGVTVTDPLPAGLTFQSATPTQGTYNSATGVWSVGTLSNLGTVRLTITAQVNTSVPVQNTGTAAGDQFDPDLADNTATATVTPQRADLAVSKIVDNPNPNVGDTVTYTITLTNLGPDTATHILLEDTLPPGVTLVSATPTRGSFIAPARAWSVLNLPSGSSATLVVKVVVTSPTTTPNVVTITGADQFDPNLANNTATATVTPKTADVSLTKSVDDPTPNVGDTVTFTLNLANAGPDPATGEVVSDPLPAGLTFQAANPSQGTYDPSTGVWTFGTVAAGGAATMTITALVVAPTVATNVAVASGSPFDPNPGNNTATATVTPRQADLAVTKSVDDPSPNVGDTVNFTVTLANRGPNDATGVTLHDLLPAGLRFVTATPAQGSYDSTTGTWTVGTVASGANTTLVLQATVTSPATATNVASVSASDVFDPNANNNTGIATVTPQQADLHLVKTVNPPHPNVGALVIFTLTLSNQGPNAATNVIVNDLLPAGLAFASATPTQGTYNAGSGVWAVGTLANQATARLVISAHVTSPQPATNTAAVGHADQFDPDVFDNSSSATVTPRLADLAVTKTVDNPRPDVGDVVTYTITLTNQGPDPALIIAVRDTLPAGVTFVSAAPSSGTFSQATGTWALPSLASGASATLVIRARVTSPAAGTNTAAIIGTVTFDPNTANNTASSTITPLVADLALAKTVDNPTPNVGDTINYTLTLTNLGPDPASGVMVSEPLPAGLTFVSSTASQGSYDPATGVWSFATLAGNATATLVITARVDSPALATNAAAARSNTFDPNLANNKASAKIAPPRADLAVTKTVDDPTPNVGDTVNFTVTLTNNGPSDATGVAIQDVLPADVAFVSATPGRGTFDSSTGTWTVGALAIGATTQLTIQATVTGPAAGTNVASVTAADQADPNLNNNTGTASITPQQADLHLVKTVNQPRPNVGDVVTFTLNLTNQGPNPATGVTVTDPLPAGLTFQNATPSQGTYDNTSGVWTVGTVANKGTARLTITARVDSPVAMINTGTAAADQFDPDLADNTANATVTPQRADLAVTKIVDNPTPTVGDTVTYKVTLTNLGPDTATNITLLDTLPAGITITSATVTTGTINAATRTWSIPSLASGGVAIGTIVGLVTSPTTTPNIVTITGADQFDPNLDNNTAEAAVTPETADISLTKTVDNRTPNVGDTVTFTLTLHNAGPDPATGVVVSDPLPAGLTFQAANPSQGTYDPATGSWSFGTLAANATATMTITARVVAPTLATNVAVASSSPFDPNPADNTATATVTPQQADLAVTKIVSNPTPNVGDVVVFTVTMKDIGPNDATNVTAHDLLPAGLTFVAATPGQGTYDSTTGTWTVGTVPCAASAALTIEARVTASGPQINVATITHSDQFDPNPSNNQGVATLSASESDLAVTKAASVRQATVGSLVTFTVAVHNLGPSVAMGVFVTDKLPAGLAFVSARPSQGAYSARTGQWAVGTLAPGGSAVLRITVRVTAAVTYRNTAVVGFAGTDPDLSNNTATALVTGLPSALSKRNLLASAF